MVLEHARGHTICRFNAALKHVSRAIDMDTHSVVECDVRKVASAEQHVLRAKLYWALGLTDAGIKDMTVAMSIAPDHTEVRRFNNAMQLKACELYYLATEHLGRRNISQAVALLASAIRIAPNDIKLLITRAAAHRQAGACEAALEDLHAASAVYQKATQPAVSASLSASERWPMSLREPFSYRAATGAQCSLSKRASNISQLMQVSGYPSTESCVQRPCTGVDE